MDTHDLASRAARVDMLGPLPQFFEGDRIADEHVHRAQRIMRVPKLEHEHIPVLNQSSRRLGSAKSPSATGTLGCKPISPKPDIASIALSGSRSINRSMSFVNRRNPRKLTANPPATSSEPQPGREQK